MPAAAGEVYRLTVSSSDIFPMLAVYDAPGWNTAEPDVQGYLPYSDAAFFLV
mgnify:CR=1 FL=1